MKNIARINKIFPIASRVFIIAAVAFIVFWGGSGVAHANAVNDLSEVYQPVVDLIKQITFMLTASFGYVFVMSHALQWIISNPQWADTHSILVSTGLGFTRSFADMLLIVIFLAIAFGFIFKIETFQSKKALPKFFIAAIMAQFAPVFVGMIVDIATVINNTLILGNQATITGAFDLLLGQMLRSVIMLCGWIVLQAAGTAIPAYSSVTELAGVAYFIGIVLPSVPVYLCQMAVGFLIGGILFMYVIFFMSRIFILQFIAIVSPLAVVAWALPQTSHYFRTIWNELIKWAFVGTLVLFLLIIGLRASVSIMPDNAGFSSNIIGMSFDIQGYVIYYLFLFIYMAVISYIVQQNLPQLGNIIQSTLMGAGGMIMANAIKPGMSSARQFAFMQKKAMDDKAAEAGGFSKLEGIDQARFRATSLLAGGMHRLDYAMNNPQSARGEAPGPGKMPTYYAPSVIRTEADELNKRTNDNPLADINNTSDWNKRDDKQKAIILKAIEDDPDKQKKLQNIIGATEYGNALNSNEIVSKLGKDTLLKHLATASPDTMNATINNPTIQKMILPNLRENEETIKMQENGFGENSLSQATKNKAMEGMFRNLKRPEDIKKSKIGKLIEEDETGEWLTAFMTKVNPGTMAKAWETFTPTQLNKMQTWRNEHSLGYLAENAPTTIQPSGQLNKLFGKHPELIDAGNITGQRNKISTERQHYLDMTPDDREVAHLAADAHMQDLWRAFDQAAGQGQTTGGQGQAAGPGPGPTQGPQGGQTSRQPGGTPPGTP